MEQHSGSTIHKRGYWHWAGVGIAGWTFVLFVLFLPLTALYAWKVDRMPKADGTLSQHRVVEIERTRPRRFEKWVHAALDFDRPGENGPVHCRHDDVTIGPQSLARSFDTTRRLAVRTDSCHGYSFLPLENPPPFGQTVLAFLFGCVIVLAFTAILFFTDRFPGGSPAMAARRAKTEPR
jgi:hypothetical protein